MLCDDEIEEFLVAFTVEKGKKKRACIKQTLFFDLTQPVRVATNKISRYVVPLHNFNLTQPVRVATICTQFQNCCFVFQSNATRVGCNAKTSTRSAAMILFQSNATRVGCNSKLAQMKQRVVMHFVQCLSVF